MSNEANERSGCPPNGKDGMKSRPAQEGVRLCIRRLEAVCAICKEITSESDLIALPGLISRRARDLLGADTAAVWFYDEPAEALIPYVWPADGRWPQGLRLRLGEGVAGAVAARREGLTVNQYRTSPFALPLFLNRSHVSALMAEPLLSGERLLGVIALGIDDPAQPFTDDDRLSLSLLTPHAATALENARLQTATVRRLNESEALLRATQGSTWRIFESPGMLARVVAEAAARMTGSSVAMFVLNAEAGTLELGAQSDEGLLRVEPHCPCSTRVSPDSAPRREAGANFQFRCHGRSPQSVPRARQSARAPHLPRTSVDDPKRTGRRPCPLHEGASRIHRRAARVSRILHQSGRARHRERAPPRRGDTPAARGGALLQVSLTQLNASLDLDTVLSQVAAAARELCAADLAQLALCETPTPGRWSSGILRAPDTKIMIWFASSPGRVSGAASW